MVIQRRELSLDSNADDSEVIIEVPIQGAVVQAVTPFILIPTNKGTPVSVTSTMK